MYQDISLLLIRIILGLSLTLHGAQKVFGLFGGDGLNGWINYITSLNIPFTNIKFKSWMAIAAAITEFVAGILILTGSYIKYTSVVSAIFMLFAIKLAHCANGYFSQNGGYEYALNLLVLSIILALCGAGKYKL
jgi:putative oxidoreductase